MMLMVLFVMQHTVFNVLLNELICYVRNVSSLPIKLDMMHFLFFWLKL
jgi:hypothetical protein